MSVSSLRLYLNYIYALDTQFVMCIYNLILHITYPYIF